MNSIFDVLQSYGCHIDHTGSREICNPPPQYTDDDYLVEMPVLQMLQVGNKLQEWGFVISGKYINLKGFTAWRRGKLNLIVTPDPEFADRFRLATAVAKSLNLLKKKDRITLFRAILYDETPK